MTQLTPSIAEDIQMLANYWLEDIVPQINKDYMQITKAAEGVEAYLSTFKPDHL